MVVVEPGPARGLRPGHTFRMDVDEVADELYRLPPAEFVPARDARAAEARAQGDRAAADAIKKLRKPTAAAWLANLLSRGRREDVDRLLDLGRSLREAQDTLAGDDLRRLSRQRHEVIEALSRDARHLADAARQPVTDPAVAELEATLEAATADPVAAEALRSGRLTTPLRYSGLGLPGSWAPSQRSTTTRATRAPGSSTRSRRGRDGTSAEPGARRVAVERAETAMAAAADEAATRRGKADEAAAHLADVRRHLRTLEEELTRVRAEEKSAGDAAARANSALRSAERARRRAEAEVSRARERRA